MNEEELWLWIGTVSLSWQCFLTFPLGNATYSALFHILSHAALTTHWQESVPLTFCATGLEAEAHKGMYSYTAHEVVDLRSARDDCSQQQWTDIQLQVCKSGFCRETGPIGEIVLIFIYLIYIHMYIYMCVEYKYMLTLYIYIKVYSEKFQPLLI